jgi:hypothetical protein
MPPSLPKVTDSKIQNWVGGTYAQRGRSYFRNGHVLEMRWRGDVLTGKVQGSEYEPYTVRIKFVRNGNGIEGDCSCPMAYDCKHVAALLYAYASAPPPAPKGPSLDKSLAKLDQPALLALVRAMLAEAPELEELAEAHLLTAQVGAAPAAGDDFALRQEAQNLVQRLSKPAQVRAAERGLEVLHGKAATLMRAGNWEAAQIILFVLLSELILAMETATTAAVDDVLARVVDDGVKCWQALPDDSPVRRESLRGLFDYLAWEVHQGWGGVYGFGETIIRALAQKATTAEREQLQEWIALAMRQRPTRSAYTSYNDFGEFEDYDNYDDYADEFDAAPAWARLQKRLAVKSPKTKSKTKRAKVSTKRKSG